MTEAEAKTKWCSMARHTKDNEGSFHTTNGQKSGGFQTCIASNCMAWRWNDMANGIPYDRQTATGYCGLAGRP